MPATTPTPGTDDEEPRAAQERPMPDEDGPHDVPDETVIEKTLPSSRDTGSLRDERP